MTISLISKTEIKMANFDWQFNLSYQFGYFSAKTFKTEYMTQFVHSQDNCDLGKCIWQHLFWFIFLC